MTIARRQFLQSAAGLATAGTLGAWPAVAATVAGDRPDDAFGFADDRVPMNAANLCPMPSAITQAADRYRASLDRDLSADNRRRVEAFKETAREGLASMLGCAPDEIAIVRNTSEANGVIVGGIGLERGDEVLVWDQNHPSNALAWDVRAAREGFTVRRFDVPMDAGSIDEVVEHIARQPGPKTRVITFTHISNVSGFRLPANEICAALRRRHPDLFIHVDGAQTWGVRDVNLADMDCDAFSGSAHKWFMGPRETGLLYVRAARQDEIAASIVSIPWGGEVTPSVTGARRYEALGQRDDAAIAALADTVAWHRALTPAAIEARAMAVADRLRAALADLDVPFVSVNHPDFRSNVVILAASGNALRELPGRVFRESGVITAPVGGLRMSPHVYNTPAHVDRVAAAVAKSRGLLGA